MESKLRSPKRFEKTRSRMVHPCDQRGLGDASPTSRILDYGPRMHCLLQYTRPVNRVSKALCAGSCLSYNGEDSRTDDALHEMKRSNVQTVSRLLIAAFD